MFSWPSLHERMCRTCGSNSGPLACQVNMLPIKLPHLANLIKFYVIFIKITLKLPQNSQKPLLQCMKFVRNSTKCDVCLFFHKICCKMVWKFCEIWKSYGNWLPDGPNSVWFHLTMWDMACMNHPPELLTRHPSPPPPAPSQHLLIIMWKRTIKLFNLAENFLIMRTCFH